MSSSAMSPSRPPSAALVEHLKFTDRQSYGCLGVDPVERRKDEHRVGGHQRVGPVRWRGQRFPDRDHTAEAGAAGAAAGGGEARDRGGVIVAPHISRSIARVDMG